jgi:predicted component of viral defense system (DUF524 family)
VTLKTCRLRQEPPLDLVISTLPGKEKHRGIDVLAEISEGVSEGLAVGQIQLLEEVEYAYEILGAENIRLEPRELFSPTDPLGATGRLKPSRATGTVAITALQGEQQVGASSVEVRSSKLNYLSEYRWMLQRIAEESAEAVQRQFAPSRFAGFSPSGAADAETLYQQFAFLQALLTSAEFQASMQLVLNQPHHEYAEEEVEVDPRRGVRSSRRLMRELGRPGPRVESDGDYYGLTSLPRSVRLLEHSPSYDTAPNQFVKHALVEWQTLARSVAEACSRTSRPAATRGLVEANAIARELEAYLSHPLLAQCGTLRDFPASNTVLQRRPGYRDVFRAYLQADAAATVEWLGSRDAFSAGQRDVAALYEYWVFLELARVIAEIPGFVIDRRPLFTTTNDRMALQLTRGKSCLLKGRGRRRGASIQLELWFNRHFGAGQSWSEPIRPDCSLLVTTATAEEAQTSKWLHFDAKYRINSYKELFQGNSDPSASGPVSADVLKMHAYRDAIRRTTGAYVLYPGADESTTMHQEFHELLPGIGAFVLRPSESGRTSDSSGHALQSFIEDAIDHLAASGTDEARSSYWSERTYSDRLGRRLESAAVSDKPAADTKVLLGFVRSSDHLEWVRSRGLYNLRADDRTGSVGLRSPELGVGLVVLYDADGSTALFNASGDFRVLTGDELVAAGYPSLPGGQTYCCLTVSELVPSAMSISGQRVLDLARSGLPSTAWGTPRVVTLLELLQD